MTLQDKKGDASFFWKQLELKPPTKFSRSNTWWLSLLFVKNWWRWRNGSTWRNNNFLHGEWLNLNDFLICYNLIFPGLPKLNLQQATCSTPSWSSWWGGWRWSTRRRASWRGGCKRAWRSGRRPGPTPALSFSPSGRRTTRWWTFWGEQLFFQSGQIGNFGPCQNFGGEATGVAGCPEQIGWG